MRDYPKAFKELEDKIQASESNGFPTKMNHAGNQQNYVPSGDEGGQYTFDGATIKPGEDDYEDLSSSRKSEGKSKIGSDNIKVIGEGEKTKNTFDLWLDDQEKFSIDFREGLKTSYASGNDDSKKTLDYFLQDGKLGIKEISKGDRACYDWGMIKLNETDAKGAFNRRKGEVFWHEFYHAFDNKCFQLIPDEEKKIESIKWNKIMLQDHMTSSYRTSTGLTLLETLTREITANRKNGVFRNIHADYMQYISNKLKDQFPDIDPMKVHDEERNIFAEINDQVHSLYPVTNSESWSKELADKKREYRKELEESNPRMQRIREYEKARLKEELKAFEEWGSISDIYGAANGAEGFCGGHAGSYWRRGKEYKGFEFIAEYGSAYATGHKEMLDKFNKYFPQTSKAAEEVIKKINQYARRKK